MSDIKWIKIVTDIFDDEKMLLIETLPEADSIIVIWFKLLCLAGKQNNSGVFTLNGKIPYTDKMLATIFRRKETIVQLALQTFEKFGMIEIINNTITIPNWSKHQNFDKIEKNNEYMRQYMKEYRHKQKLLTEGKQECKVNSKVNSKVNVSGLDKNRIDKNRIEKNRIDKNNIIEFYNNNVGNLTPYGLEILESYLEDMSEELIIYAMKLSVEANKKSLSYIKAILNNWINNNIKTIEQAKQQKENKKDKEIEEWLNE